MNSSGVIWEDEVKAQKTGDGQTGPTFQLVSMTQLLSHTVAHFTGPSFML